MSSFFHTSNSVTLCFMIFSSILLFTNAIRQADDLPGWMGGKHQIKTDQSRNVLGRKILRGKAIAIIDPLRIKQLSWHPRALHYSGFLSHKECDYLIKLAKDKLTRSEVENGESEDGSLSEVRTSSGMFLEKYQDDIITLIEERIAAWTFLPKENGEGIQILRYNLGEKYEPHYDYFFDKKNVDHGGHRVATVLMYLSDVENGGETVFPNAANPESNGEDWSECAKQGLSVKPRKGDAILFFSLHPNGTTDPASLHSSCPVEKGVKWSATKWIHVGRLDATGSEKCEDNERMCSAWAASGECEKNPVYMVGDVISLGSCRKSCKVCKADGAVSS